MLIKMKKNYIAVMVIIFILVLIWSPWITKNYAEKRVAENFQIQYQGVADGCGLNCEGCGIINSQRTLFGYKVDIRYKCGLKDYFQGKSKFVSFIGIVH